MKNLIKVFSLFCLLIILATCKKDKPTEEENLTQHEQKIINQIDEFMPKEVGSMFETQFKAIRTQQDYSKYLDSIETSINELKNTIQLNFSLSDYQAAMNKALLNLQNQSKGTIDDCMGLGYSKGVKVDIGIAGKIGAGIVAGAQAAAGAGVKVTYDFVNLDRQVYIYSFCSAGISIGVGIAAELSANVGFSGVNEVITGIRYYGNSSGLNRYSGQSISTSYSLGGKAAAVFGVGLSLGVGTSSGAVSNFNGIENQDPCTATMIPIANGTKAYSFKVTGTLSDGPQSELIAVFNLNKAFTKTAGIASTYKSFADNRPLAGIRMAKEIMLTGPFPGVSSPLSSIDLTASAVALIYSLKDFSNCPPVIASIATKPITNLTSAIGSCGGVITNDGGSNITTHGIVWSTSENPGIDSYRGITNDGTGKGEFTSKISNLSPNTNYYVRAYATNSAGTAYGTQVTFKTPLNISTPTVNTTPVTVFTSTSATVGGNITADGGVTVTEHGVFWGNSSNPETTGTKLPISGVTEVFSTNLLGLNPNTIYYVNAYAINSQGTAYGTQISFTTPPSGGQTGTVTDIDGNVYSTVAIGTQVWMAENLKTTRYSNGTNIPFVNSSSAWSALPATSKAYCWYDNDIANKDLYGALYTETAAMNGTTGSTNNPSGVQGACPTGWHLPSKSEYEQMITYLGGGSTAYTKLIQGGSSGFNSSFAGLHDYDGAFAGMGTEAQLWSSTYTWWVRMPQNAQTITWYSWAASISANRAFSVRCVRGEATSGTVPTNGLIAYYPFNGNANDESGNGYNGTVNGPTLSTDRFANANRSYSFADMNIIDMGNILSDVFVTNNYSLSLWYNKSTSNNGGLLNKWQNCCPNTGNNAFWGTPTSFVSNILYSPTLTSAPLNTWVHWVVVMNSGTLQFYIDGVLKATQAGHSSAPSNKNLMISSPQGLGNSFIGKVDDVRIYNRPLTADEVQALYHEGGW